MAQFTRAYPDRFIGITGVDLHDPVNYVQEVEKYVKVEGFKGSWPLYVKCIKLNIPFLSTFTINFMILMDS
ncbi:hypothetical protein GB937_004964 [Aspergillus fischeri]|nr:hypothetical protein GB937_004964 [Aspergillus fischeri]